MAKERKPDSKLYEGPVEEICGNPNDHEGSGNMTRGGEDIPGGQKESGGVIGQTVTYENVKKEI
jgi:hypothetical protein